MIERERKTERNDEWKVDGEWKNVNVKNNGDRNMDYIEGMIQQK